MAARLRLRASCARRLVQREYKRSSGKGCNDSKRLCSNGNGATAREAERHQEPQVLWTLLSCLSLLELVSRHPALSISACSSPLSSRVAMHSRSTSHRTWAACLSQVPELSNLVSCTGVFEEALKEFVDCSSACQKPRDGILSVYQRSREFKSGR